MGWFTETSTYEKPVKSPEGEEATVTYRRLNAGDLAEIQDSLRVLEDSGDTTLAIGTMRQLTVQKAVVNWTIPGPKPSVEAIAQLDPKVFEQVYGGVELNTGENPPNGNREQRRGASRQKAAAKPS